MGQTTQQIEADIQETRDSLGSNLGELERRARAAADWKQQVRAKPGKFLSLAFGGGVILAALFGGGGNGSNGSREAHYRPVRSRDPLGKARSASPATSKMWDGVKVAVVGAATTRLMQYLNTERPDRPTSGDHTGETKGAI